MKISLSAPQGVVVVSLSTPRREAPQGEVGVSLSSSMREEAALGIGGGMEEVAVRDTDGLADWLNWNGEYSQNVVIRDDKVCSSH